MEPIIPIAVVTSLIIGAFIAFIAFGSYFRNRKSEVASIANPAESIATNHKKPQQTKKSHSKPHHSHADKVF